MIKKIALICMITGVLALMTAILLAFAVGGPAVPVLTISSIVLNALGITLLRGK